VPTPHHKHVMAIRQFYLGKTPVTRRQYAEYLRDSKYVPTDTHNFLRNWTRVGRDSWRHHPADADKPVVHVSLRESRLYCAHYGWRLPHTWEWSYAAQGTDGRAYPWGVASGCKPDDATCQVCCPIVNLEMCHLTVVRPCIFFVGFVSRCTTKHGQVAHLKIDYRTKHDTHSISFDAYIKTGSDL
jgi:hypothetical protein